MFHYKSILFSVCAWIMYITAMLCAGLLWLKPLHDYPSFKVDKCQLINCNITNREIQIIYYVPTLQFNYTLSESDIIKLNRWTCLEYYVLYPNIDCCYYYDQPYSLDMLNTCKINDEGAVAFMVCFGVFGVFIPVSITLYSFLKYHRYDPCDDG